MRVRLDDRSLDDGQLEPWLVAEGYGTAEDVRLGPDRARPLLGRVLVAVGDA